jgi:release factor glutamine methyltransferase
MIVGRLLQQSGNTLDVKILLAHILNIKTEELVLFSENEVSNTKQKEFKMLLNRRILGEPVAKIINKKYFWRNEFFVNQDVLDPRPDTESIMEATLVDFKDKENVSILDLGTGSGCLIISLLLELKNSSGVAVDINEKSLDVAKINAKTLGVSDRIDFLQDNWNDNLEGKFDIIVSNPPYIKSDIIKTLADDVKKYEPHIALDGGINGLLCYNYIAKNIGKNCKSSAVLYFEVGHEQAELVKNIFETCGFHFIGYKKDIAGIDRVVILKSR